MDRLSYDKKKGDTNNVNKIIQTIKMVNQTGKPSVDNEHNELLNIIEKHHKDNKPKIFADEGKKLPEEQKKTINQEYQNIGNNI